MARPGIVTRTKQLGKADAVPRQKTILLDISDLVFYIGHHENLTGIQRVQACLILGLLEVSPSDLSLVFLSWDRRSRQFLAIDKGYFERLLKDLVLPTADRVVKFDFMAAREGILPSSAPVRYSDYKASDNILVLLGAAWVNEDYFYQISKIKRLIAAKFACVMHDMIPIFARETCDQGTAEVFRVFIEQALYITDLFICVSRNTQRDLERFCSSEGWPAPNSCVITHAAELRTRIDFDGIDETQAMTRFSRPAGEFVLFVSTLEGRKNHKLAYSVWERIYQTLGDNTPQLICVGRYGWRAEEFVRNLMATNNLHGKIQIRSEISDEELDYLYKECMFTLYPSLYEGWGLPISESLSKGKVCVCANNSSMPEAGQDFATYIDASNVQESYAIIHKLVTDPEYLESLNDHIRREFRPKTWMQAANEYVAVLDDLFTREVRIPYVEMQLGREYVFRKVPVGFGSSMGDDLYWSMDAAYRGNLTRGSCSVRQFFEGHQMRGEGAWKVPEPWGTWIGVEGAVIEFAWPEEESRRLVVGLAYRILRPFASRFVTYTIDNQKIRMRTVSPSAEDAIHILHLRANPGVNRIKINMDLSAEDRARSAEIDGRQLMMGVRSMILIAEEDLLGRLDLYETIIQMPAIG
jgi:glycosyltransferase involved in cell wall biosynthesis